ncbi:MAG: glycosyltransferase family 4 protein [Planctomycetales bacterium]|nr:glycosyltransferase family 4 protein [Planctomycetales bacterium]MCA9202088.1 glycosyltransferase family 4 protein [Planctomycetales bacterium]
MRVAHIITRMIVGGAQENTLFNCLDLRRMFGDEVLLITGPETGPEGDLIQQGRAGELPVRYVASLQRAIQPTRDWAALRELKRVLREFRPDVVHTHSAKGGMLGRMAAHAVGVPAIIHTVHGAPFHPYQRAAARELFRQCERYAARRCHRLVSVAEAMTDMLVDAGVAPRDKFVTVYSGMDVEPLLAADSHRQRVREELGYRDEHVVVGKIARLFHLKGHEYVIDAARLVAEACPQVRFLFVGDGILRRPLEDRIAAAGLSDRFQFTGLVPPSRIPELIGAMDVLVHASLREGLARALPQALIAGRPAVSYDVDGAREVVLPGETGFLLPPKSIEPMANALIELAGDESLRRGLGQGGRDRFTEQFRHEHMTRELRKLYETVLAERAGE